MLKIESSSVYDFAKHIFVMINSHSDWFSGRGEGEKEARKEGREGGRGKEGKKVEEIRKIGDTDTEIKRKQRKM